MKIQKLRQPLHWIYMVHIVVVIFRPVENCHATNTSEKWGFALGSGFSYIPATSLKFNKVPFNKDTATDSYEFSILDGSLQTKYSFGKNLKFSGLMKRTDSIVFFLEGGKKNFDRIKGRYSPDLTSDNKMIGPEISSSLNLIYMSLGMMFDTGIKFKDAMITKSSIGLGIGSLREKFDGVSNNENIIGYKVDLINGGATQRTSQSLSQLLKKEKLYVNNGKFFLKYATIISFAKNNRLSITPYLAHSIFIDPLGSDAKLTGQDSGCRQFERSFFHQTFEIGIIKFFDRSNNKKKIGNHTFIADDTDEYVGLW